MNDCSIFSDKLLQDAQIHSATIHTSFITDLTEDYDPEKSGIWQPLVITPGATDIDHRELLSSAGDDMTPIFNPCACNSNIFGDGSGVSDILNSQDFSSTSNIEIDSSYCTTCADPGKTDSDCQVRSQKDDYIPKIPYLYQGYISGFYDFKNMKQFPSCSNIGLGKEKFIEMDLNSFEGVKLNIDLKLQETISEIPYDPYSTRHETEYIHDKSYKKSRMKSETCGSFLSITGFMPSQITQPYGFTKHTYDNVYMGISPVASHWKWNYQSGILGWYRHYDIERETDYRPIAGMDLYIPPGDVFFATPDGPEYSDGSSGGNTCPSGLKIVVSNQIAEIVSNDEKFFYISANLFSKFLSSEKKISETMNELTPQQARERALLLTTHPSYDGLIANLHSVNIDEDRDDLGQLTELNQMMTSGTQFGSAFGLYHCDTRESLIKTLAHKYGAYVFIEPDSSKTLKPVSLSTSSYSIELDFDMVIPKDKVSFSSTNGSMLPDEPNYIRNFKYEQEFTMGGQKIVWTSHNSTRGFDESCSVNEDGAITYSKSNYGNYASLYFYDKTAASVVNNSGSYLLENKYANDQPDLIRAYPATAFNPHIDVVAMHKQGGIYANSLPFNLKQSTFFIPDADPPEEGEIGIKFTTEDCGIKIYDIQIKKLQTNLENSKECERFPYDTENTCQCFGFKGGGSHQFYNNSNAKTISNYKRYTPNLSTNNSPILHRYGGYDQAYLNILFSANAGLTAGAMIAQIPSKINPLFPYGEEKQDSITLPNYVNTKWTIKLKNLAGGTHSDTIVTVNENVNLTANRFAGDPSDPDYTSNHNLLWKRFTTKVTINSKNIYDQQSAKISVGNNTDISVKLQNPFLAKLIQDDTGIYAPPDNSENLLSSSPALYSTRGDESSNVTLTFTRKPRKQLLNFWFPPPRSYGSLTKGEYDPNKGLKSGSSTNNPFKEDKPYYDHTFDDDPDWDTNKGILYGPLNTALTKLAATVGDFEAARKLRLYVKVGGVWYVIGTHKRGSYIVNNKLYIGRPKLFEYLKNMKYSQSIPMFFPLSPKKLISWNAFLNHSRPMKENDDGFVATTKDYYLESTYPFLNGRDIILPRNVGETTKTIFYPGTRYYFMADEEISVVKPKGNFDEENPNTGETEQVEKVVTLTKDIPKITSTYPPATIVSFDGNKFYYIGGQANKPANYFYLGDRYKDIVKLDNNLDIRYDENTLHGYVYNSKKTCDHKIKVFQNNKGVISTKDAKIIEKEIVIESLDIDGKPTLRNIAKYNLYTKFTLEEPENIKKLFSTDIANYDESTSLCVYLNQNSTDTSEYLYQEKTFEAIDGVPLKGSAFTEAELRQLNWFVLTKWSDVIKYDNTNPVSDLIINPARKIKEVYPFAVYNNWFYKQIVNSFSITDRFKITNFTTQQSKVLESSDVLYCILQKYNVNKNPEYVDLNNYRDYHNFIPMMDINIMNQSLEADFFTEEDREFLTSYGSPVHASIQSPNWTYEHNDYEKDGFLYPGTGVNDTSTTKRFWVNIEENDLIEAAYVPAEAGVYSETLRLDDPLFWLDSTIKSTKRSTEGVRTTFTPTSDTLSSAGYSVPGFGHKTETRDYAFNIQKVYGDGDDDEECGVQDFSTCFISSRGSVSLTAKLKLAKKPQIKSTISDASEFFFTYDAGTYNPIGQKNLIKIWRSELKGDNPLDSAYDHCSTSYMRPDYNRTFLDPERINVLNQGSAVVHNENVKNLDKYANEILFRILYGEDDKVNKNILNSKKRRLTADDLVNFTEPRITAADIYDEILYNYDTAASCNCIQGSFSVHGPRTVGTNYSFTIASQPISFSIIESSEGSLIAQGTIGSQEISAVLASSVSVTTGMTVTDIDTELSDTENTTYTLRTTSAPNDSKYYGVFSERVYTGTCAYGYKVVGECQWKHTFGTTLEAWNVKANHFQNLNYSTSDVMNCGLASPGGYLSPKCGGNATPRINYLDCSSTTPELCPDRTCNDYEIGYCRRKSGCTGDGSCYGEEDMQNFLYTFKQCRTTFNVYGYKYKELTAETEEEEEEEVSSCYEIQNGNPLMDNYPYDGVADTKNWGPGENGFYRGNAGSACGAGNGYGGGNTGFEFCCSSVGLSKLDEYTQTFDEWSAEQEEDSGDYDNKLAFCAYQANQCTESTDSPRSGDPGFDACGFYVETANIPARKYYTYRQVTTSEFESACPQHICNISYNKNSITISIGGKTICSALSATLNSCPKMTASLPAHAHISDENISNDCDDANAGQVILASQKQNYQTLTYTHKQYLGGMSGGDANPMTAIQTMMGNTCGLGCGGFPNCLSWSRAICGASEGPWIPLNGPRDSRGTFAMALASWQERMTNSFNNVNQELGADVRWLGRGSSGQAGTAGVREVRNSCNANTHIPEGDIVRGMVPGTCSDLQFETQTFTHNKTRATADSDGAIESSTWNSYLVRAYITYDYIRPVTIQDKLKGYEADAEDYACAQEGVYGPADEYPEWYASRLGLQTRDTLGYPIQNYGRSNNYIRREQYAKKLNYCGDSLTSYSPKDYYKDGDENYPFGGAPCGRNNYVCWSENRDWITVWLE